MPKKKTDTATLERFERALRKALNTQPENPRKKTRVNKKKKVRRA
jgi:hypothetical protein